VGFARTFFAQTRAARASLSPRGGEPPALGNPARILRHVPARTVAGHPGALAPSGPDVALDLQVLFDQCYQRGRYSEVINYAKIPEPPLPPEEAAWANEVLAAFGKQRSGPDSA
jgi:hypothetical protein